MPKILDDEQIYRAVIQAVSKDGYSGTTTKKMAAAADISEVTLFRKYGSKEQLVKASLSFIIAKANLESASKYTGDVHADLTRMVRIYHDLVEEYGDFVLVIIFEVQRNRDLLDLVSEPLDIVFAFMRLIARYQNDGILVKEPPLIAWASLVIPVTIAFNMEKAIPDFKLKMVDLRDHVTNFLAGRLVKTNES